jgi:Zn-dependent protease with chaperone function
MVSVNDFLLQIFQPYFFYSVVFLSIAFVSIKIFLKFNPSISRRHQSIIWLVPLFIPVAVLLIFPPQAVIGVSPSIPQISVPVGMGIAPFGSIFFSFTGLMCISGAVGSTIYLLFMMFFGRKIALKRLHVVMMAQDEYLSLQEKVKEIAHKLRISEPKIGLVDDLLPNAFTTGYGRNTVIVFSLGLLNTLDLNELTAVASHELAHVEAKDYLFKSTSCGLNILSFFNPLSYFAASQSQKERELLADEKGSALLDRPNLMAEVLTKVMTMVQEFPKPSLADRLSTSLFLVSPLAHRSGILATHPQIAQRVQNIHSVASTHPKKRRYMIFTALFLGILVCTAFTVGYSTIQVQKTTIQKEGAYLATAQSLVLYNESAPFNPAHPTGIFFVNESSLRLFLSSLTPGNSYVGYYVDANGVTHTYTSAIPNITTINGQSVLVNGHSSFLSNESYPLDTAQTSSAIINKLNWQSSP